MTKYLINREAYNADIQIIFKTLMLRSCLRDYSDPYILVKGTITVAAAPNDSNTKVIFKN